MFHHTKTKGDLAVMHAQLELTKQGWLVCLPQTEHAPFDLVAYKDGVFKRVQVKYKQLKRGAISARWDKYIGSIDVMCLFEPESETCYFVPLTNDQRHVTIRVVQSKNNQSHGVRPASDFTMLAQ